MWGITEGKCGGEGLEQTDLSQDAGLRFAANVKITLSLSLKITANLLFDPEYCELFQVRQEKEHRDRSLQSYWQTHLPDNDA